MATVTIFAIACTKTVSASDVGSNYSLEPWGDDTDRIQGDDDGGTAYELPEGYSVARTVDGTLGIFDAGNAWTPIVSGESGPCLIGPRGGYISLGKVRA